MYQSRHIHSSSGRLNALLVAEIGDLKELSVAGLTTRAHLKNSATRKNDGLALALCVSAASLVIPIIHTCPCCHRYCCGNEKILTENESILVPPVPSPAESSQLTPPSGMHEQVY